MKKIFIILYFTMCFAIGFSQTALQTFVSSDNLSSAGIGLLRSEERRVGEEVRL